MQNTVRIKVYMYRYLLAINVVFCGVLQVILKKKVLFEAASFFLGVGSCLSHA